MEERGHPLFQPWVPRKAKRESKSDRVNSLMFLRTEKRRKTGDKRKRENKGKNKKSKRTMLVFQYVYPQYRTPYSPNHKHVHRGKRTSGAQVHLKRCMIIQSIARYDLVSPERQGRLYKCEVSICLRSTISDETHRISDETIKRCLTHDETEESGEWDKNKGKTFYCMQRASEERKK